MPGDSPDHDAGETPRPPAGLDELARQGANPQVPAKKVLLAYLAQAEARRLGITPGAAELQALADAFCAEIGLTQRADVDDWLAQAGLTHAEFMAVLADFAAVLAVEQHYRADLAGRVALHRRLMAARAGRAAGTTRPE